MGWFIGLIVGFCLLGIMDMRNCKRQGELEKVRRREREKWLRDCMLSKYQAPPLPPSDIAIRG